MHLGLGPAGFGLLACCLGGRSIFFLSVWGRSAGAFRRCGGRRGGWLPSARAISAGSARFGPGISRIRTVDIVTDWCERA